MRIQRNKQKKNFIIKVGRGSQLGLVKKIMKTNTQMIMNMVMVVLQGKMERNMGFNETI